MVGADCGATQGRMARDALAQAGGERSVCGDAMPTERARRFAFTDGSDPASCEPNPTPAASAAAKRPVPAAHTRLPARQSRMPPQ